MSLVLVTGAHGFIGRHLAHRLHRSGCTVVGLGHGAWPEGEAAASGVSSWLNGDITASNLHALARLHGLPEVVFHLAGGSSVGAAIAGPREDFFRTVATTAELLEWIRQETPQTRLVAVSSAAVYGAGHKGPIVESAALRPYSPYGYHKLMMETLCRSYAASYGLHAIVARLFSVYGAGLRKQLLWDLCTKLESGALPVPLGGTGAELRDWTDVRDVVRALVAMMSLASPEVPTLNIGTGVATTVQDVAACVITAWKGSAQRDDMFFSGQSRAGDPFSLHADARQLSAMGFEWQVPVSQGLQDYVHWFRSRPKGNV